MKNKKNFYISRFYINDVCVKALSITKKASTNLWDYHEASKENEAGGITHWFRVNIDPKSF